MSAVLIGPDRVARWVKSRLERELRGALPPIDLEEIANAGVKAIRAKVIGVAEQAKELVHRAQVEAAKALKRTAEDLQGEAEKEAAKALRGGGASIRKRVEEWW